MAVKFEILTLYSKSMPDLKHSDLMQELKHKQEEIKIQCMPDTKSFSSRFVSQTKPPPQGNFGKLIVY